MDPFRSAHAFGRRAYPVIAGMRPTLAGAALAAVSALIAPGAALADKISNPIAVFDGLDKITGRIISFEVAINETVQFGALQITPRVCYSRPPTDAPQTDAFAQVDEIDEQKQVKRIFSGWMFADSPRPARRRASDFRYLADRMQRRHGGDSRRADRRGLGAESGRKPADRHRDRCGLPGAGGRAARAAGEEEKAQACDGRASPAPVTAAPLDPPPAATSGNARAR